jgi:hypothetical protein
MRSQQAKNIYFRVILTIFYASFFLPTVVALPFTPQAVFYVPFWLFSLFIYYPKIFISKEFIISYLFLILHFIYVSFGLYGTNEFSLLDYFSQIAFSFSLLEYFKLSKDYVGFKYVTKLIFILLIITCGTNIVSLSIFPDASRGLAGYLSSSGQQELIVQYLYYGISSYDFFHTLAFISPIYPTFFLLRKIKINKYVLLTTYGLYCLAIYRGGYSSAFGILLIGLFFSFFISKFTNQIKYLFFLAIFGIFFSFYSFIVSPALYFLADTLNSEFISPRLINVAANLDKSSTFLDEKELIYTVSYENQKEISLKSFYSNVLTGGEKSGGHHFFADFLGRFGIIGFVPLLIALIHTYFSRVKLFSGTFKILFIHIFTSFIFVGFFKPIGIFYMLPTVTFIVPAFFLYAQNFLNKSPNIRRQV